jgi:hypothetical protein
MTRMARRMSGRRDITVTIAPGAGAGSPGFFDPNKARIELDAATMTDAGVKPSTVRLTRPHDNARYLPTLGVLAHEAAHARSSRWRNPRPPGTASYEAAEQLEETRIEARHVTRRPQDRPLLRASAATLILPSFTNPTNPAPAMDRWTAGAAAALLLARVDAGILTEPEVATVRAAILNVLGPTTLDRLTATWRAAHKVEDTRGDLMSDLGILWCEALNIRPALALPTPTRPDRDPNSPHGTPGQSGDPAQPGQPGQPGPGQPGQPGAGAGGVQGAILSAVRADLTGITPDPNGDDGDADDDGDSDGDGEGAARDAREAAAHAARVQEAMRRRESETAARKAGEHAAKVVFTPRASRPRGRIVPTAFRDPRPPTVAEQAAARRLARAIKAAGYRDRTRTTITSPTPPGRLNVRAAMARDAQRAVGATPTAEPFTTTINRATPRPPLRVGIATDVSGSMSAVREPVATASWILATAVGHVPDATTASVIFGRTVRAVTRPG